MPKRDKTPPPDSEANVGEEMPDQMEQATESSPEKGEIERLREEWQELMAEKKRRQERIAALFAYTEEPAAPESQTLTALPLQELSGQLNALNQEQIPFNEYTKRSKVLLDALTAKRSNMSKEEHHHTVELQEARQQMADCEEAIEGLENRLRSFASRSWLYRVWNREVRKNTAADLNERKQEQDTSTQKKKFAEQKIKFLTADIEQAKGDAVNLEKDQYVRRLKHQLQSLKHELAGMTDEYNALFTEIVNKTDLVNDMAERFMQTYLRPAIERYSEEIRQGDGNPPIDWEHVNNIIQSYLQTEDFSGEKYQAANAAIAQAIGHSSHSELQALYQPLLNGGHKQALVELMQAKLGEELSGMQQLVQSHMSGDWREVMSRSRNPDMAKAADLPLDPIKADPRYRPALIYNLRMWDVLRQSDTANAIFGDTIAEVERQELEAILLKAPDDFDGQWIDKLEYLPRPEAVRMLVILAAADYRSHRTEHANWVLSHLAKRADWEEILSEAEISIPELKSARARLRDWAYNERGNEPTIQAAATSVAKATYGDEKRDAIVRSLAAEALPNSELVAVARERNLLPAEAVKQLEKTFAALKQITDAYSDPDAIANIIRNRLLEIVSNDITKKVEPSALGFAYFEPIMDEILAGKTDRLHLSYLVSVAQRSDVLRRAENDRDQRALVTADRACPALASDMLLQTEFLNQFTGRETLTFFQQLLTIEPNSSIARWFAELVGAKKLTQARALELAAASDWDAPQMMNVAKGNAEIFLQTDDGVVLLHQLIQGGLSAVGPVTDTAAGKRLVELDQKTGGNSPHEPRLWYQELAHARVAVEEADELEISDENWQTLLMAFATEQIRPDLIPAEQQKKIRALFQTNEVKDFCLDALQERWRGYTTGGDPKRLPFTLSVLAEKIHADGAATLSHVEALGNFIHSFRQMLVRKGTAENTKAGLFGGIGQMEARFAKERFDRDEQSNFYHTTGDIMSAAPRLAATFLEVANGFKPTEMKVFLNEVYPLYRAKLAILKTTDRTGKDTFPPRVFSAEVVGVKALGAAVAENGIAAFAEQRKALVADIQKLFKDKFGITKVPETFGDEETRAMTNLTLYLGNLSNRTPERETIIGFYLALILNGKWEAFRAGETIDPAAYLIPDRANAVSATLKKRAEGAALSASSLGIGAEKMPTFQTLLQRDTEHVAIGDVETVDVKIGSVIANLEGLRDLDLYPDPLDKARMALLLEFGNKTIGAVAAKLYQEKSNPGKTAEWKPEEKPVKARMLAIMEEHAVADTPAQVKKEFQDAMKPLAVIVNMLIAAETTGAKKETAAMRDLLKPSAEVIAVFTRLGEDFTPESGALAVSQDLNYLDNLINKREKDLTPEEKKILLDYVNNIRAKLVTLEKIYQELKVKFSAFKQSQKQTVNPQLKAKLEDMERVILAQASEQTITSVMTGNLVHIIENIRECLSCRTQGANNDTNLTFGDSNKFFLFSHSEGQKKTGSIADQIVFVEPTTYADGTTGLAFVFDRVYGANTASIIANHIATAAKKYREIKKAVPECKLSFVVPQVIFSSAGATAEGIKDQITKKLGKSAAIREESVTVNVAPSPMGDHYIEFGGSARSSGERQIESLVITLD